MTKEPWTKKYCPKTVNEVQGHNTAIEELERYIKDYKKQKKKAALVYGGSGVGKTCLVHALANDLGFEILEVNASDFRNSDAINSIVGSASQQSSLFNKGKVILVDEIDGLAGREDRGGVGALKDVISRSSFPVILTANDPWDKKFSPLRNASAMVQLRTPTYISVYNILKHICKEEKIKSDDDDLKRLARRAGGDFRAAINDLQNLTHDDRELKKHELDELGERNQIESMNSALVKVFKTRDFSIAIDALSDVDEDLDTSILWIDENLPKEYTKPEDLYRAYDKLSKADVFRGRIRRWQYWRLLVYVNALITAGVAVSKDEKYSGFVNYRPTKRIFKYWLAKRSNMKRDAIAEKVAFRTHTSKRDAIKNGVPYLRMIFKKNKNMANSIADELDLNEEEVVWLRK